MAQLDVAGSTVVLATTNGTVGAVAAAEADLLARRLAHGARDGYPGIHPDDVAYCLAVDRYDFTMVATRAGPDLVLRAAMT